jgi:hypothetical protein
MFIALASGLLGSLTLTTLNETVRQFSNRAPRLDLLGEQAVANVYEQLDEKPPEKNALYNISLTGDLASNAVYYSLAAAAGRENAIAIGAALGAAAGLGTVFLPEYFGIKPKYSAKTPERAAMTVGYYLLGGLAAGIAYNLLTRDSERNINKR